EVETSMLRREVELMQYDAETPQQYLAMIDDDWRRERLLAIRDMLLKVPKMSEGIAYGMLQYRADGEVFAHLNAQKAYVGVYLGELERFDPDAGIRGGMNFGKSCLRVRKRDDLGIVQTLIERKVAWLA
ncbi:MAG: DUF1801 domain-containing protein, partial [Boseongicola sp.]